MPSYERDKRQFEGKDAQVVGISVDNIPCHEAWARSLGGLSFPLLSDFYPHGAVAQKYGVLRGEGIAERAIFIIDKKGIIRYIDVHDIGQKPENKEIFQVLRKL